MVLLFLTIQWLTIYFLSFTLQHYNYNPLKFWSHYSLSNIHHEKMLYFLIKQTLQNQKFR